MSLDHSILSPSGRVSKAARERALKRAALDIFGPDGMPWPSRGRAHTAAELLQFAAELRHLAATGMRPRVHIKRAVEYEAEANAMLNATDN